MNGDYGFPLDFEIRPGNERSRELLTSFHEDMPGAIPLATNLVAAALVGLALTHNMLPKVGQTWENDTNVPVDDIDVWRKPANQIGEIHPRDRYEIALRMLSYGARLIDKIEDYEAGRSDPPKWDEG
jgi:hypothetical protein